MERESGYYWVKVFEPSLQEPEDFKQYNGWEVAFYRPDIGWQRIWDMEDYQDGELLKIDENKLTT